MKSIGEFFARIRGKQAQELRLRFAVREIVKRYAGIEILPSSISFSMKAVSIKGLSQAAKSALFVKQSAIIKEIQEKVPERPVDSIRFL